MCAIRVSPVEVAYERIYNIIYTHVELWQVCSNLPHSFFALPSPKRAQGFLEIIEQNMGASEETAALRLLLDQPLKDRRKKADLEYLKHL
ncbi:MAG: hypothetical protein C0415_05920 [Thermodesulfovibrio sp.]|nr:hypothetical protein [Thermodesulfovibrio sp.]